MKTKNYLNSLVFIALIFSCSIYSSESIQKELKHKLVLEDNEYISCLNPVAEVQDGDDCIFKLNLEYLATIDDCSYEDYSVEYISDSEALLTLKNVEYSSFISLTSSYDSFDLEDDFELDEPLVTHKVVFEENPDIKMEKYVYDVNHGDRLVAEFDVCNNAYVLGVSYRKKKIIDKGDNHYILVLHNIRDNLQISFKTTKESITYEPNGGRFKNGLDYLSMPITKSHLRANSIIGSDYMFRPGYYQIGWNTLPDYSGDFVSFGSRFDDSVGVLYAQWEKYTEINSFLYLEGEDGVILEKYIGDDSRVCIPKFINRTPVTKIRKNSFSNTDVECLIIPDSIVDIENDAFADSKINEIYVSDNLYCLSEYLFGGHQVRTCHISALNPPINSGTYFDAFQDKIDYLDSIKDDKKIILFGGSSVRYGYWSEMLMEAFPEYKVVNMGVFAYVSAKVQLEVIKHYLKPGDIVLDSPEFDSLDCQFFYDKFLEIRTTYMFESNYDSFSYIDLTKIEYPLLNIAGNFQEKAVVEPSSYEVQAKRFDDDMNKYNYDTYNIYGDFTLERPCNPEDTWISQPLCDYTIMSFDDCLFDAFNAEYRDLKEMGVDMLFTYAPKNIHCLTDRSTEYEINRVHSLMLEKLECPVISDIWDSLFPGNYFYLIDNHLCDIGATIRTENVIRDLNVYFSSKA